MTFTTTTTPLVGAIESDHQLSPEQVKELHRLWDEALAEGRPIVLGPGMRLRVPGEYEIAESTELAFARDWLPYVVGTLGWIAAIVAIVVR